MKGEGGKQGGSWKGRHECMRWKDDGNGVTRLDRGNISDQGHMGRPSFPYMIYTEWSPPVNADK